MYYSNGNYEAFARPKKPEGVDDKNAYIIGTGLAALTAACYLVRDAQIARQPHSRIRKGRGSRRCLRWREHSRRRLRNARRPRNGQPLRSDVDMFRHPSMKRKAFPYLTSITG